MSLATAQQPCPKCGKLHRVEAEHYYRIITECGQKWFVLQPKRNGPFVLRIHPGEPLTRQQMAELDKKEKSTAPSGAMARGGLTT